MFYNLTIMFIKKICKESIHCLAFTRQLPLLTIFLIFSTVNSAFADDQQRASKRIEVYELSQNYWDTQYGDTLSQIVYYLLPNNPAKRESLKQDILHLNPGAFPNGNPANLLAGKRLWLPGYAKQADSIADPSETTVETYSWGNIKRPKN